MRSVIVVRQRILVGLGGGFTPQGGLARGGIADLPSGRTGGAGRPFVVDGTARHAGVVTRADWLERRMEGGAAGKPDDLRRLAAAWLADAQAEHASIA